MDYVDEVDGVLFEDVDRDIMQRVFNKIKETKKGKLAKPLKSGELDTQDIYKALMTQRCLHTTDYDVGPMYLKSAIANAIHDAVPDELVNRARHLFGMKPKKSVREKHLQAGNRAIQRAR